MAIDETTTSKRPSAGELVGKVVAHEIHAVVVRKALACRLEHELGEVDAHTKHFGSIDLEKGEQPPVARPEVEDATSISRHVLEQDALSLCAARIAVRPAEIALNVLGGRPFPGGHAFHYHAIPTAGPHRCSPRCVLREIRASVRPAGLPVAPSGPRIRELEDP